MSESFGTVLTRARGEAGESQKTLAAHLDVSVTYLCDVERDKRSALSPGRILAAASFLHADPLPLFVAAIRSHGVVRLAADTDRRLSVGALLASRWHRFAEKHFMQLEQLLAKVQP